MTIFSDNPHDRRIERFMTAIPNFKPRGVGVRFSESQVLITITAATPTEILAETMRQIPINLIACIFAIKDNTTTLSIECREMTFAF